MHLYDVCEDPSESHNLLASTDPEALGPEATALLLYVEEKTLLSAWLSRGQDLEVPPEVEEQLRSLGYVQ